jgi:hypothetical protein
MFALGWARSAGVGPSGPVDEKNAWIFSAQGQRGSGNDVAISIVVGCDRPLRIDGVDRNAVRWVGSLVAGDWDDAVR